MYHLCISPPDFTGPFENTMYFSRQKIKTKLLRMRWASENKNVVLLLWADISYDVCREVLDLSADTKYKNKNFNSIYKLFLFYLLSLSI